jgi:hypothetical protein
MQLNLRIQAYFMKICFERLRKIVPKLRHSSRTVCPNSVKKIEAVAKSMQMIGLEILFDYVIGKNGKYGINSMMSCLRLDTYYTAISDTYRRTCSTLVVVIQPFRSAIAGHVGVFSPSFL